MSCVGLICLLLMFWIFRKFFLSLSLFYCGEESHGQGNLDRRNHFIWGLLTVSNVSLCSWWQPASEYSAGRRAESSKFEKSAETLGQIRVWTFETSKLIPSDTLPPTRPHLLILLTLSKRSTKAPFCLNHHKAHLFVMCWVLKII